MKVLFLDPVCLEGHVNFNKIHLLSLMSTFDDVDCCFVKGYTDELNIKDCNLKMLKSLRLVKRNINLSLYDIIIISCYDEISLWLSHFPRSFIINHNNLSKMNHWFKRLCYKRICDKHVNIVLNDNSFNYLKSKGVENIVKVVHGLMLPYKSVKKENDKFVLFTPSPNSTDKLFTESIIKDKRFINWLEDNDAVFILRGNYRSDSNRIKVITGRINFEKYKNLLMTSNCLYIAYPPSFKYRVSAVVLEAIANKKNCVLREIEDFREYENIYGSQIYFHNVETLIESLDFIKNGNVKFNDNWVKDNQQTPDYSILKDYI